MRSKLYVTDQNSSFVEGNIYIPVKQDSSKCMVEINLETSNYLYQNGKLWFGAVTFVNLSLMVLVEKTVNRVCRWKWNQHLSLSDILPIPDEEGLQRIAKYDLTLRSSIVLLLLDGPLVLSSAVISWYPWDQGLKKCSMARYVTEDEYDSKVLG